VNDTTRRPFWSVLTLEALTWSPEKRACSSVGSGWPCVAVRGGVADARDLDHDAVRPGRHDDRLGHARRVHAPLDDVLDDLDLVQGRRLAVHRKDAVLDLQATLQVEAELGLDPAAAALLREGGQVEVRPEVEDEGEDAHEDNEDRSGSTHDRGC
jgi:hypothetical protein